MGKHQKELLSSTAVYSLGTLLTQFISFLLLPLYTRYLGPTEYGILSLVLVFSAVLSFFSEMGFVSGIMRFFPTRSGRDAEALMSTALWTLLGVALLFGLVLFPSRHWIGAWVVPGYEDAGWWIGVATMTALLTPSSKAVLKTFQLRKQASRFVVASFIQFLANISVTITLVVGYERGVEGVLLGQLAGQCCMALISLFVHFKFYFCRPSMEAFHTLLGFSAPLVPANISALVIGLSDRFFLERLATLEDVGVYAVADKMATVLQVLLVTSFANAWHQFVFTHQGDEELKDTFASTFRLYGLVFICGIVVFSFVMPEALMLATTAEFVEGYRLVPLLCVGPLVQGWVLFTYDGIHLAGKTRQIPMILGSGMMVNLVLNALLIPSLGTVGAALATALSMMLIGIWAHRVSHRLFPVEYPIGVMFKAVVLAAVALGVFLWLDPENPWVSRGLRAGLLTGFCVGLWFGKIVRREDVDAVWVPVRTRLGM